MLNPLRAAQRALALVPLAACGSPHDTRPPRSIPDEVRELATLNAPFSAGTVVVRATMKVIEHPPRTGGWEGTEVGPMPRFPEGEWVEAWVEVRATPTGRIPVIIDRPEPEGYRLGSGPMRRDPDAARSDLAAASLTHCWSADGRKLAVLAQVGATSPAWVVFDFTDALRIGQFMGAEGACTDTLVKEPITWHATQPG